MGEKVRERRATDAGFARDWCPSTIKTGCVRPTSQGAPEGKVRHSQEMEHFVSVPRFPRLGKAGYTVFPTSGRAL